ncbi:hypothetical protein [Amycolatopsis sp. CB00013]|uniref:hypothetical protein n=1 Tax=Amycolatopsis sp. CB00013 TaxID=1703945 RepID=UPI00095EA334|nr:hypothetical protein [Amycolatopsis sp. CB00013]OKJ97396.1 hypothetical protein AMK34_10340 [Amycolatopsis sp. CB00013]
MRVIEACSNPSRPVRRLLDMVKAWSDTPADVTPQPVAYQTQRQLRPDEVATAVARFEAGASMQQIADQLDVHRTTILKRLQSLGITTRFSKLEPDEVKAAAELYGDGWTLDKIAKKYHVAASTVRDYLLAAGMEMRPRGRQNFPYAEKIDTT